MLPLLTRHVTMEESSSADKEEEGICRDLEVISSNQSAEEDDDEEDYDLSEAQLVALSQPDEIDWDEIVRQIPEPLVVQQVTPAANKRQYGDYDRQKMGREAAGSSKHKSTDATNYGEIGDDIDWTEIVRQEEEMNKRQRVSAEPAAAQLPAISPASSKRRQSVEKSSKQSKIHDYACFKEEKGSTPELPCNTKDQVWCNGRMFKKNETWKTENGQVFTLQKFHMALGKKSRMADCGRAVHIKLEDTFIGPKVAKRLCETPEWTSGRRNPDMAVYNNLEATSEHKYVELKKLHSLERGDPPEPTLIYECRSIKGVGFNKAYLYKTLQPVAQHHREPPRTPVVLELFAGCGGMSEGFKQAGFDVKYMVEENPAAAATLRCNSRGTVFEEDVNLFLKKCEATQGRVRCYPRKGDVDHLHASPPCQGFSTANTSGGRNDKRNNSMTLCFAKAVRIFQPRTASFENVTGILQDKKKPYLQETVGELLIPGYQVRTMMVDASDYGDPQQRKRVIVHAARRDCALPYMPAPTHSMDPFSGLLPKVMPQQALEDLARVPPTPGSGIVELPDGTIVSDHNSELQEYSAKTEDMLVADDLASTIKNKPIKHYRHRRCITVRERARIQSFPDNFQFCGSHKERRCQIGNAVPVNLATAIAKNVMESHTKFYDF